MHSIVFTFIDVCFQRRVNCMASECVFCEWFFTTIWIFPCQIVVLSYWNALQNFIFLGLYYVLWIWFGDWNGLRCWRLNGVCLKLREAQNDQGRGKWMKVNGDLKPCKKQSFLQKNEPRQQPRLLERARPLSGEGQVKRPARLSEIALQCHSVICLICLPDRHVWYSFIWCQISNPLPLRRSEQRTC